MTRRRRHGGRRPRPGQEEGEALTLPRHEVEAMAEKARKHALATGGMRPIEAGTQILGSDGEPATPDSSLADLRSAARTPEGLHRGRLATVGMVEDMIFSRLEGYDATRVSKLAMNVRSHEATIWWLSQPRWRRLWMLGSHKLKKSKLGLLVTKFLKRRKATDGDEHEGGEEAGGEAGAGGLSGGERGDAPREEARAGSSEVPLGSAGREQRGSAGGRGRAQPARDGSQQARLRGGGPAAAAGATAAAASEGEGEGEEGTSALNEQSHAAEMQLARIEDVLRG